MQASFCNGPAENACFGLCWDGAACVICVCQLVKNNLSSTVNVKWPKKMGDECKFSLWLREATVFNISL